MTDDGGSRLPVYGSKIVQTRRKQASDCTEVHNASAPFKRAGRLKKELDSRRAWCILYYTYGKTAETRTDFDD